MNKTYKIYKNNKIKKRKVFSKKHKGGLPKTKSKSPGAKKQQEMVKKAQDHANTLKNKAAAKIQNKFRNLRQKQKL